MRLYALGRVLIPTLHDALITGIEPDTFFAVSVIAAEHGAFPAAKRMPCHRHRNRYIDADHADFDTVRELLRRLPIVRITGDAIPEFVRVYQVNGRFEIGYSDNAEHRSKDFFAVNRHFRGDVI